MSASSSVQPVAPLPLLDHISVQYKLNLQGFQFRTSHRITWWNSQYVYTCWYLDNQFYLFGKLYTSTLNPPPPTHLHWLLFIVYNVGQLLTICKVSTSNRKLKIILFLDLYLALFLQQLSWTPSPHMICVQLIAHVSAKWLQFIMCDCCLLSTAVETIGAVVADAMSSFNRIW